MYSEGKLTRGCGTKVTETFAPKEGVIVKLRIVCLSRRGRDGQARATPGTGMTDRCPR